MERAGYLTIKSTMLAHEAVYWSEQALIAQGTESDHWSEYQANSIKARIIETALDTQVVTDDVRDKLNAKTAEYRATQGGLKEQAEGCRADKQHATQMSKRKLFDRDLLMYAGVAVQLAIALASLAAMTKKDSIFKISVLVSVVGIIVTVIAVIHQYF